MLRFPATIPSLNICNHLFFIDREGLADSVRNEILENIAAVNACLLNVTDEQLKDVASILLVAGTRKKSAAMRQLMDSAEFRIRVVCTDSQTAADLL